MVKDVGWWKTFGMLILLMVAIWAVALVIGLLSSPLGRASESAGGIIGGLLFIVFEVVVGPFVICYISTMYLGSGGVAEPAIAGAPPVRPAATPSLRRRRPPPAPVTTRTQPADPSGSADDAGVPARPAAGAGAVGGDAAAVDAGRCRPGGGRR